MFKRKILKKNINHSPLSHISRPNLSFSSYVLSYVSIFMFGSWLSGKYISLIKLLSKRSSKIIVNYFFPAIISSISLNNYSHFYFSL